MESLIQVFRMNEISVRTRIDIIKALGDAINAQFGNSITQVLVLELVLALDPENEIQDNVMYTRFID